MLTQVLIVGAGPAGLVLGCELERRGIHCVIAEKDAQPFAGSRGKGLQPRTQEVLEDLGVLDDVRAFGGLYPALQVHQGGQVVFEGRMDPLRGATPDVPYPNVWMLPQWRTGEILRARLAELGGSVWHGAEIVSVTQDADRVKAVVRAGSQDLVVAANYLVGADGGHSLVRRELGIGFAGQTREEQRMIVADVRADGISRDWWHVWNADGAGFRLGMCPLAGTDTFQLTAPIPVCSPAPDLTRPGLQRIADEAAGPGRVTITDVSWTSVYRTNIRMAQRFRAGRAFLVGDAAHVHSPAGGQGLNTSIQDAYNLGWKLTAVLRGAPASLLDSYEAERLPVAADVLGITTKLHAKAVDDDPDAHRRDDPELRQLNLGYRESPLSREYRSVPSTVRAGDRAPDAPGHDAGGKTTRLFDLIHGGRTTLLAFGPVSARHAADLVAASAQLHAVSVTWPAMTGGYGAVAGSGIVAGPAAVAGFVDTDGHARRAYGITENQDAMLVIRPDGYLGLAVDSCAGAAAQQVRQYLSGILGRPSH